MAPEQPDWSLLSQDAWRRVLDSVRTQSRKHGAGSFASHLEWTAWWRLVARVSGTCRSIRGALLGPKAAELWRYSTFSAGPTPFAGPPMAPGLRTLLRRQARHTRSAWVWAGEGCQLAELAASMAALTSLHKLEAWHVTAESAACIAAALGSRPASVACYGHYLWQLFSPAIFAGLKQLHLSYVAGKPLAPADVQALAQRLPNLQLLELCVSLGHASTETTGQAFGLLGLLPACSICLEITLNRKGRALSAALLQLARSGAALHTVRLIDQWSYLAVADELILAGCGSWGQLVFSFGDPARRLQHVPSGLAVLYEPMLMLDYKPGQPTSAAV